MARTKEKDAEVEKPIVVSTDEGPVEEAEVTNAVKMVKIHVYKSTDAIIGGDRYTFTEDSDHQVPADVAAILVNGEKAYRL